MKRSKTVFDFVSNNTSESTSVSEAKLEGDLGSLNIESNRILISRNKSTGFQPLGFKKGVYSISELKSFYDGFDDAKWQSFISRLDLGVVRNLGLDSLNRREMIECYNFCISASDPMIIVKRSREMGRMPLLRHLLFDEYGVS